MDVPTSDDNQGHFDSAVEIINGHLELYTSYGLTLSSITRNTVTGRLE